MKDQLGLIIETDIVSRELDLKNKDFFNMNNMCG